MFEVNTFTPHQTGVLFSWLVVNRGPCSYAITFRRLFPLITELEIRQCPCPS